MIVRQVTNRLQECGLRKSAVQISKIFGEVMKGKLKIIVQVIFHVHENFNNSRKWKNTSLETRYKTETESCADWKNCDDCEKSSLQEDSSHKSTVRISKFSREIVQDKSNIVF